MIRKPHIAIALPVFAFALAATAVFADAPRMALPPETAVAPRAEARLVFRPSTEVAGEEYTLGDIAEVQCDDAPRRRRLEQLVLGPTPSLGYELPLHPRAVAARLARLGVESPRVEMEFPHRMSVERASQQVDMEALKGAVRKAIVERFEGAAGEVLVESIRLPDEVTLEAGALDWDIHLRFPSRDIGTAAFMIDLKVDGRSERKVAGSAQIDQMVEVFETARAIARGQAIGPDAVRTARRRKSEVRGPSLDLEAQMGRLVARRALSAGDVLNASNTQREVLVRVGQPVRLVLETADGMRIATTGRVKANGALGDMVDVINAKSGRRVTGVVAGRRTVRVPF